MVARPRQWYRVRMPLIDGTLLIARHHESQWNKRNVWTGSRDVHITEYGKEMSYEMGLQIRDFHIDQAICSQQHRSKETLDEMLRAMGKRDVPVMRSAAVNERDYGIYTGKNKHDMEVEFGHSEFEHLHRDFDYPIPDGETLRMVYDRAVPFYLQTIVPMLHTGENVLLVSHGNTLRSLMKYIESISDTDISTVEMPFSTVYIYRVDEEGRLVSRDERFVGEVPGLNDCHHHNHE